MNDPRLCPHCGFDLMKDAPIILNDFAMMSPLSPLSWKGKPIDLAPAERAVIWTIFKSFPRAVTFDVILDRIDSESEGNIIDVYLSRVRTKLRAVGAPIPYTTIGGRVGKRAVSWRLV